MPLDDRFEGEGAKCIYDTFCCGEANITRASNGQIASATEPGCRQNRRPSQSAVVAGVRLKPYR